MSYKDPEQRRRYRKANYQKNRDKYIQDAGDWKKANRPRINAMEKAKRRVRTEARKASEKAYYERNKEAIREKKRLARREYYAKNREKISAQSKAWWRRMSPDKRKDINLRANYGITVQRYEEMLAGQRGVCAICGDPGKLHVDHDHVTEKIRGLLCGKCNTAIGLLREDTQIVMSAAKYIAAFKESGNTRAEDSKEA